MEPYLRHPDEEEEEAAAAGVRAAGAARWEPGSCQASTGRLDPVLLLATLPMLPMGHIHPVWRRWPVIRTSDIQRSPQ
jgi:hypothetical protein